LEWSPQAASAFALAVAQSEAEPAFSFWEAPKLQPRMEVEQKALKVLFSGVGFTSWLSGFRKRLRIKGVYNYLCVLHDFVKNLLQFIKKLHTIFGLL
jgi:hypothetical protein